MLQTKSSQDPTDSVARATILHQKSQTVDARLALIDELSANLLSSAIYNPAGGIRGIGVVDILYPEDYSKHKERMAFRNTTTPCFHQTEFLMDVNENSQIEIAVHFLQPKFRRLREIRVDDQQVKHVPRNRFEIEGKIYEKGFDTPVERVVLVQQTKVKDLLKKPIELHFEFDHKEDPVEAIVDNNGKELAQFIRETLSIEGRVSVSVRKLAGDPVCHKVTLGVINTTRSIKERPGTPHMKRFNEEEVVKRSLTGVYSLVSVNNGTILSPIDPLRCANINTSPTLSTHLKDKVFSSPVILYDYPRVEPVLMDIPFADLVKNEESLIGNMSMLTDDEKQLLSSGGKKSKIFLVFKALFQSNPKLEFLYKFQWDAIQTFVKKLLKGDSRPLIIVAPTATGKSLVFYVCAVLMTLLREGVSGTTTFITFPTRALNSLQFSEMVGFFYHLNKLGVKATLGLYMGGRFFSEDSIWSAVASLWPPDVHEGLEIPNIEKCPACGHDKIIAHKPDDHRILPICEKCGEGLDFVFLSNMETQEFCPNVIVGTPDKIVNALTTSVYSHTIFGAPCKECPTCHRRYPLCKKDQNDHVHYCPICKSAMGPETLTRSTPCFVIFDEVHTLVGTQGNLLGQFLSLLRVLNEHYGVAEKYWYLGATATIVNREELVYNLTAYPSNEQQVFPDEKAFWSTAQGQGYFFRNEDEVRHRYILLEPLDKTTRWSVSWIVASLHDYLKKALDEDRAIMKKLRTLGSNAALAYKTQTVYVTRKDEGRDLEKWIPDLARDWQLGRPWVKFGCGDLSSQELAVLNKLVREHRLDILVVTQIYGQGVDFPGLNILHFFGTPKTFIELAQVVGRTGREAFPSLVLLHLLPNIPRDQWVYQNFRQAIRDMDKGELFEPTPINVLNRYAISLSIPNVFNTLVLARAVNDHQMRFAQYVSRYFTSNPPELIKLVDQMAKVYLRDSMPKPEELKIRQLILRNVRELLMDFKDSRLDTTKHLQVKQILIPTLREKKKRVRYREITVYPIASRLGIADEVLEKALGRPEEEED
jgi:hypothetical protein